MSRITIQQPAGHEESIIPYGYRPRMAATMSDFAQAVYQETTLTFREAEGARIRIAQINGCLMCQGYRIAADLTEALKAMDLAEEANTGANRGEAPSEEYYRAAMGEDWRSSDLFSERERLAIDYAERIALTPIPLPYDDAFWGQLKAHYDEGEIADLTYSINTWIATGRMVHALGLDGACMVAPTVAQAAE